MVLKNSASLISNFNFQKNSTTDGAAAEKSSINSEDYWFLKLNGDC